MKFIQLTVKNHQIMHGFDENNQEILESIAVDKPIKKLIAINRIQSISEKFILTSYLNRLIYWEYEERFIDIVAQLKKLALVIDVHT